MDFTPEIDIEQINRYEDVPDTIEDSMDAEVVEIFKQLREKPFRNADQRKEMIGYLTKLYIMDTQEVRRLFREIGKLLNDLADNGMIDGSSNAMEESVYVPYFEQTAKKYGLSLEEKKGDIEIPGTNVMITGLQMDTNGNKTLYLSTFAGQRFKIQTNGRLPYIHRNFDKRDYINISNDPVAIEELKDDLKELPVKGVKIYR